MSPYLILLYGCIIVHGVDTPPLVYLLISRRMCGLFLHGGCCAAGNLHKILFRTPVFSSLGADLVVELVGHTIIL